MSVVKIVVPSMIIHFNMNMMAMLLIEGEEGRRHSERGGMMRGR